MRDGVPRGAEKSTISVPVHKISWQQHRGEKGNHITLPVNGVTRSPNHSGSNDKTSLFWLKYFSSTITCEYRLRAGLASAALRPVLIRRRGEAIIAEGAEGVGAADTTRGGIGLREVGDSRTSKNRQIRRLSVPTQSKAQIDSIMSRIKHQRKWQIN